MPRILIVKTSSMGDVIHALPAISDLCAIDASAQIDWVVESAFAGLVPLHPKVSRIIRSDVRKWKRAPFSSDVRQAVHSFKHALREYQYDYVVDLQGLLKSAWIAKQADGPVSGFNWGSIREPLASMFYAKKYAVSKRLHAVERNRALLAAACGYALPTSRDYGLRFPDVARRRLVVCCHATSRDTKLWPEPHWRELIAFCEREGVAVGLPWGSAAEHARAERLAAGFENAKVWPRDPFPVLARDLAAAACVVGVDTGLVHLSCAVGSPTLGIYTATDPTLSGAWGGQAPAVNLGGIGQTPSVAQVIDTITPWLTKSR